MNQGINSIQNSITKLQTHKESKEKERLNLIEKHGGNTKDMKGHAKTSLKLLDKSIKNTSQQISNLKHMVNVTTKLAQRLPNETEPPSTRRR
jgi:hypothetical protein